MKHIFSTTDWLARHEGVCLMLLAVLVCVAGAF